MPRQPLILIVDDFRDGREMYVKFLRFHGFRVIEASDGQSALNIAGDALPDLVVLDLGLPGLDGWEIARRLKTDSWTKGIPVIALTGHVFADSQQRARAAGCDAFLTKPCLPDDLLAKIRELLPE
ncbi:MAG TPA: response regulator [Methylomirabilota bacterium]|jgi:CheY-like chemotaxis protein|nr:response regulator [Methylomirabilota bacterium]